MTDPLNRSLKRAIVKHCLKSESRQMINHIHCRSIMAMPEVMWIMFDTSFAHLFRSDEGLVRRLNIDFPICLANEDSIMAYAKSVHARTGINTSRVSCDDVYWVYRVINPIDPTY